MPHPSLILLASVFSYRVEAFEQAAQSLGIPVVRGEDVPPPMLEQSRAVLPIDYRDVPAAAAQIQAYAAEHPVGAVVGLDDSGTLIAASASTLLGLPYNSLESALAARDKHLMRQKFAAAGVPSPRFRLVQLGDDLEAVADETAYPCVVKPLALSGSRGVMRADHPMEFLKRVYRLKPIIEGEGCQEFLVEDYIPGVEVALEGLLENGRLHVLALFDKPDPLEGPFFEESIYVTPSRLPAATQLAIAETTQRAAAALGLVTGPVHAELRVNESGPWMVEVAARSIGGQCSKTLRFGTDMSLEELLLRQAFGLPYNPERERQAGGVMMIPIPHTGLYQGVDGLEAALAVPLIEEIEISARENHPIKALPEGDSYLGFIFARGARPEAVEAALREAHRCLHFRINPEVPLKAF